MDKSADAGAVVALEPRVRKVILHLQSNWNGEVRIPVLARLVHLSPVHLQHLFKRETGMSIRQFVMERRLTYAAYLLRYSRMAVKEVCYTTGFTDASNFHRAFKKRFGTGPAAFRRESETGRVARFRGAL